MKPIALLLLVFLTSSCGLPLVYEPVTIKELLPVGSTLRLTQALEIPAGHSYVYIAHGKVAPFKAYNSVNIYSPHCMFRLNKVSSEERQVMPDQFVVTKVVEWEDYHGQLDNMKPASIDLADKRVPGFIRTELAVKDDAGPSNVMYATIMSLHSDRQPEVKELVCGHWDDLGVVEPLTLKEMEFALGDLIIIDNKN